MVISLVGIIPDISVKAADSLTLADVEHKLFYENLGEVASNLDSPPAVSDAVNA